MHAYVDPHLTIDRSPPSCVNTPLIAHGDSELRRPGDHSAPCALLDAAAPAVGLEGASGSLPVPIPLRGGGGGGLLPQQAPGPATSLLMPPERESQQVAHCPSKVRSKGPPASQMFGRSRVISI